MTCRQMSFSQFVLWLGCCMGLVMPLPSLAWGRLGHEVMASMSYEQLMPRAKAEVDRLLALEPDATLGSISSWADEHRNQTTAKWHYVNLPRGDCTYGIAQVVTAWSRPLRISSMC